MAKDEKQESPKLEKVVVCKIDDSKVTARVHASTVTTWLLDNPSWKLAPKARGK